MTAGQLNTTEKGGGSGAKFAVLAQSCLRSEREQSSEVRREKVLIRYLYQHWSLCYRYLD